MTLLPRAKDDSSLANLVAAEKRLFTAKMSLLPEKTTLLLAKKLGQMFVTAKMTLLPRAKDDSSLANLVAAEKRLFYCQNEFIT
jgi:hypothetical protein